MVTKNTITNYHKAKLNVSRQLYNILSITEGHKSVPRHRTKVLAEVCLKTGFGELLVGRVLEQCRILEWVKYDSNGYVVLTPLGRKAWREVITPQPPQIDFKARKMEATK